MSKITVTTIAGATSGADANKVKIESGDTLEVVSNATVGGTAAITGNTTVGGTLGVTGATTLSNTLSVPLANSNNPSIRLESPTTDVDFAISSYNDANGTYVSLGANHYLNSGGNDAVFDTNKKSAGILLDARNNGRIQFLTANTGVATSRMEISKDGYVTQSKLPMFNVIGGGHTIAATGQTTITSSNGFNGLEYDPDSLFNATNGRFTAPVAGRYFFIFSIGIQFSSGYHYSYLFKNGANISGLNRNVPQSSQFQTVSIQAVLNLAAGDYITAERNNNNISGSVDGGMFSGFLLG